MGGYRLISGDGMVLTEDNVLYVVRPAGPLVAKLRLNARYNRGRLLSETTDPSFHSPTTAAIAGDRLLVVNSQFSGGPSAPPWTVSSIRASLTLERKEVAEGSMSGDAARVTHLGARSLRRGRRRLVAGAEGPGRAGGSGPAPR